MATVDIIIRMIDQTGAASSKTVANLKNMATQLASVAALAAGVGIAMKKAFDLGKEGATLEFTATKFDRLSESIGTTSEALLGDLKKATGGIYSDMELMASATDFVALGLAKTHDEAVRLATVSGGLNMNMNQLVLTLTNMTTMRFDALGVSVDGFKDKVKELEKQGYSTEAAFKEAFLQQAEMQLDKVGNAADSTLGSYMRLEAQVKDTADAFKEDFSAALLPVIEAMVEQGESTENTRENVQAYNIEMARTGKELVLTRAQFNTSRDAIEEYANSVSRAEEYGLAWERALGLTGEAAVEAAENVEALSKANSANLDTAMQLTKTNQDYAQSQDDLFNQIKDKTEELNAIPNWEVEKLKETQAEYDKLTAKYDENAEEHKKRLDSILLDMTLEKIAMEDGIAGFSEAEYAKALAVAETMGAVEAAALRETMAMDAVSTAVANGTLKIEDMQAVLLSLTSHDWTVQVAIQMQNLENLRSTLEANAIANPDNTYYGGGRASGGNVFAGMSYTVGEQGRETFTPSQNGVITPNSNNADVVAAIAANRLDPNDMARAMMKAMAMMGG